jgi:FMN reductase
MIIALSANTHMPSKTRALLETLVDTFEAASGLPVQSHDLVVHGREMGACYSKSELPVASRALLDSIEQADGLIVTSPVYKGSYSGLFKHVFDLVDSASLRNKPVLLGATGGGLRHALMVEHQMRPLFGFFGALSVPTAVYASDSEFADGRCVDPCLLERCREAVAEFLTLYRGVVV